jgi:hypothetical protein
MSSSPLEDEDDDDDGRGCDITVDGGQRRGRPAEAVLRVRAATERGTERTGRGRENTEINRGGIKN